MPPTIIKKLNGISVKVGEPFSLITKVDGFPVPDYKWFLNGDPVKFSDARTADIKGNVITFSVLNAEKLDSGTYKLVAENAVGSAHTEATINILGRCKILHSQECKNIFG